MSAMNGHTVLVLAPSPKRQWKLPPLIRCPLCRGGWMRSTSDNTSLVCFNCESIMPPDMPAKLRGA